MYSGIIYLVPGSVLYTAVLVLVLNTARFERGSWNMLRRLLTADDVAGGQHKAVESGRQRAGCKSTIRAGSVRGAAVD